MTDCCTRDLEKAVEDLSELLEQPIDTETIGVLRQRVTDKTVSSRPGLVIPRFLLSRCDLRSTSRRGMR